jgi:hypothetical protein
MPARTLTFGVVALAVLALAANAGAVTGRVVVKPSSPTVGKSATIQVQLTPASGETVPPTLYLRVISPRGGSLRVPLARVGKTNNWRTAFLFADKGKWQLRAIAGKGGSPRAGSVLGSTTVDVQKP